MREETLRSSTVSLNTVEFGRLGKVSIFVLSANPEIGEFTGRAAVVVC